MQVCEEQPTVPGLHVCPRVSVRLISDDPWTSYMSSCALGVACPPLWHPHWLNGEKGMRGSPCKAFPPHFVHRKSHQTEKEPANPLPIEALLSPSGRLPEGRDGSEVWGKGTFQPDRGEGPLLLAPEVHIRIADGARLLPHRRRSPEGTFTPRPPRLLSRGDNRAAGRAHPVLNLI